MLSLHPFTIQLPSLKQLKVAFSPQHPVYVFHHLPKCGGTSLLSALDQWFSVIKDYRAGWTSRYPNPVDLETLRSANCLCGHFELEGYHLHQRYPQVLKSDHYRVFTFIRDPLQVRLSLYRYEWQHRELLPHIQKAPVLEDHLLQRPNYLASIFPVTWETYQSVLDCYWFIGSLEQAQTSLNALARRMGKPSQPMPLLNATQNYAPTSDEIMVSPKLAAQFREVNALDYAIYDYCQKRFEGAIAPSLH
ncbi:MAG: sulfotransferase family protein [Kaiparowitsia implicata GSE-PSE-MK54-09C]|nr:sulfotransferase family protein [Kaiparowitsia implicata GSE-PSE-MK54-09C]